MMKGNLMKHIGLLLVVMICTVGIVAAQDNPTEDWLTYESDAGGYSFMYPDKWTLTDGDAGPQLTQDGYMLTFFTDLYFDETPLTVGGLPAGDVCRLDVIVSAYRLSAYAVMNDEKTVSVFYDSVATDNARVLIQLDVSGRATTLPTDIIRNTHMVVSTLQIDGMHFDDVQTQPLIAPSGDVRDTWIEYLHPTEPFGFLYPPEWTLTAEADRLILEKDSASLVFVYAAVQVLPDGELDVHAELPPGERRERSTISAFHTELDSWGTYLQGESAPHAIVYAHAMTADHVFAVWLTSDTPLSAMTIETADLILTTFKTRPPE